MIRDVLAEAIKVAKWEEHLRGLLGDDAQAAIDEANRKALYQGGTISHRLADAYRAARDALGGDES